LPAIELSKNPEQYPSPDVLLDRAEKLFTTINTCLEPEPTSQKTPSKRAGREGSNSSRQKTGSVSA
jgi:hypothetical protein